MLYCDSRSRRPSEASKIIAVIRALADDNRSFHDIKFIVNFADKLLQNILEREQSQYRSEFVDDHGHPARP